MTKELLKKQIEDLRGILKKKLNKLQPLRDEIRELEKSLLQLRLKTELITDLTQYNNKHISSIKAFDSNYEEVCLPTETISITDGKLECTDFWNGIVYYSKEENSYIQLIYGSKEKLDIAGFLDIEIETD